MLDTKTHTRGDAPGRNPSPICGQEGRVRMVAEDAEIRIISSDVAAEGVANGTRSRLDNVETLATSSSTGNPIHDSGGFLTGSIGLSKFAMADVIHKPNSGCVVDSTDNHGEPPIPNLLYGNLRTYSSQYRSVTRICHACVEC